MQLDSAIGTVNVALAGGFAMKSMEMLKPPRRKRKKKRKRR